MNNTHIIAYICIAVTGIVGGVALGFILYSPEQGNDVPVPSAKNTSVLRIDGSPVSPAFMVQSTGNSLVLADESLRSLYKISSNGTVLWKIDEKAAEPYGFWQISGVDSDGSGNIYLSDLVTDRIFRFTKDGVLDKTWGGTGVEQGQFRSPHGIAVLPTGKGGGERVYVGDTGNHRVQIFNTSGEYTGGFQVFGAVNSSILENPPQSRNTSVRKVLPVTPEKDANPRFVERTFTVQSSNEAIPLSFQVNRSVYLGAKKNTYDSQDVSLRNPEEWVPVLADELADPTTRTTLQDTLEVLLKEGNLHDFDEREMIEYIAHFVQQIPLTEDSENRYPVEILHDKTGNSYDKALFLYGLLLQYGYDAVFLAYPGHSHAGVGIRLKEPISSETFRTYRDEAGHEYLYINPDGPSFFGGLDAQLKSSDPFVIHLREIRPHHRSFSGYLYSLFVVESIINLYEKYQFLLNKEKEVKGDDARAIKEKYQKIKSVLDYIEKNPSNTEGAYMRLKNSKVSDIIV